MSNPEERDVLQQELLEYLYGCHEDPAQVERRLQADAELRALLEDTRALAGLLDQAASDTAASVKLTPPPANQPRRILRLRPWHLVAAGFVALFVFGPKCYSWWKDGQVDRVREDALHVLIAGPSRVPAASPARYRIETRDLNGTARAALVTWTALDADGQVVQQGESRCDGTLDFDLDARLGGVNRLQVLASAGGFRREVELDLQPLPEAPLAHLSTDKAVYRPGEPVLMRAVLLDRASLAPREGLYRFRIADPKGTAVVSFTGTVEDGTLGHQFVLPEDAAGGEYVFELRNADDSFTFEGQPFLVQRFQPPRLAKTVTLDRETYAPGETGSAELRVERAEGGHAAGAAVHASLLVDGDEVWSEQSVLDPTGRAVFTFAVPDAVARGEGRFVARVTDGGVVETAVEPFVIPTGEVLVDFYPEGGDLVAGARNRVYVQVRDVLERPASGRGRVMDDRGREVVEFETRHQGRGHFTFQPEAGRSYRLHLESPSAVTRDLPEAKPRGVVLHAVDESTSAGQPLRLEVHTPGHGPWMTGVYCRGRLVAQDAFRGAGRQALELALPDHVAGVLRVTLFDSALVPVAERLVHRESGRRIEVAFELARAETMPGDHQTVHLTTRDESGQPVAAMVGLSVFDRAVQDQAGRPRVGIADQTWFLADVEELEDLDEFLIGSADARNHVDLVLGTEGWRRFAWRQPEQVVEEHGDPGRRLLARDGVSQLPTVREEAGDGPALLASARREARQARRFGDGWAMFWGVVVAAAALLTAVVHLLQRLVLHRLVLRPVWVAPLSVLVLAPVTVLLLKGRPDMAPGQVAFLAEAAFDAPTGEEAMPVPEAKLEALGYAEGEVLALGERGDGWGFNKDRRAGELRFRGLAVDQFAFANELEVEPPGAVFFQDFGLVDELRPANALFALAEDADELADEEDFRRWNWKRAALFREYAHRRTPEQREARVDFAETVYWNAYLRTDATGHASVEFDLSDRVTTWTVHADAHGAARIGQGATSFESLLPFFLEAKVPVEVTAGDQLLIPVAVTARGGETEARTKAEVRGPLRMMGDVPEHVDLTDGRGRTWIPVEVLTGDEPAAFALAGQAGRHRDQLARALRVVPRGFPHRRSHSGVLRDRHTLTLPMPEQMVDGSLEVSLKLYPSPLADMLDGLDGLMREPCGCFEQASSANYPNILALAYLRAATVPEPAIEARGRELLARGYDKLVGYECSERGYEWFGGDPGHEALTAYGLLEFHDMAEVFEVDRGMLDRTRKWLLDRRDGSGGFQRNDRALDSFGRAPAEVTDAYITYALAATGEEPANIAAELDRLAVRAVESDDAYELGVAACALQEAGRTDAADAARDRLKGLQQEDGSLVGSTSSITSSRGRDLGVETTSFAILAWLADPEDQAAVEAAVRYLRTCRQGSGTFGATQATIQALKALKGYAEDRRRITNPGRVEVLVNGEVVAEQEFNGATRGPLLLEGLGVHLEPGDNTFELVLTGDNEFPFALDVRYHSDQPASDPDCALALRTELVDDVVEEGKPVALRVEVQNVTGEGLPMGVAVIGLPAGLEVTNEVLDDLRDAGRFDLWERNGRELIFYWRDFAPEAIHQVNLDLVGRIPGVTRGPASRAWLYYTPSAKQWTEPLAVEVLPAR